MNEYIEQYKLEHFFNSSFVKDLVKISIIKNPDGSYELFDKYTILSKDKKYIVQTKHAHDTIDFYSLQNAVTWCIYTEKDKFPESSRIHSLDKIIESVNFSIISLKSKLKKTQDVENILIYTGKLSQDEAKRQLLLHELSEYRTQANYWQRYHFNI